MIAAADALARLREGNRRFVANQPTAPALFTRARQAALVAGQDPFAIVLGCSDSRVPVELVFDQGFGDLFVIRVAGNVVAPSQIGSVEFAAARFGTRLVVVLGHSQCGAIVATLEAALGRPTNQSRNLRSIVDRVRPSVEALLSGRTEHDLDALVRDAVRANVHAAVNHLRHGSTLVENMIRSDGLMVVGAEYSLESGEVAFLESETITIARADVAADASRALVSALNDELRGIYSEPGATHFQLDPREVAGGRGAFLIVYQEGMPVGCGALRLLDAETAELKRMYVAPEVRGTGLGRRLVAALEAEARTLGVRRLVLETGVHQAAALALYRATGFEPVPLYGEYCLSPETSVCLGKELRVHAS